jgi:hypothetical protein
VCSSVGKTAAKSKAGKNEVYKMEEIIEKLISRRREIEVMGVEEG